MDVMKRDEERESGCGEEVEGSGGGGTCGCVVVLVKGERCE